MAWVQLNPVGGPPSPRVLEQGGAYDPVSNTLMFYGGFCDESIFADFWVLSHANGLGGTPTWTQFAPSGGPGPRAFQTMVYDPTSNELILFSGLNQNGTALNDVWVLTNANGTAGTPAWNQLSPVGGPPTARGFSSATYDPVSNRMTIFGGGNSSSELGDAWVLTNANGSGGTPAWTQIAQSSVDYPAPRDAHTAVYDGSRNVMIVFGGEVTFAGIGTNDVFFLSNANGQ